MILSGEEAEEYRDTKPYYNLRFLGKEHDSAVFRNGYARDVPGLIIGLETICSGIGKLKWGAEVSKKYFVLYLEEIVDKKNINK